MRLLQGLLLLVVVLDASLMMTASASSTASPEQVTMSENTVGPNAPLMSPR